MLFHQMLLNVVLVIGFGKAVTRLMKVDHDRHFFTQKHLCSSVPLPQSIC